MSGRLGHLGLLMAGSSLPASDVVFLFNANPSVGLVDESSLAATLTAVGSVTVASPGGLWSSGYVDFNGTTQALAVALKTAHNIAATISGSTNWSLEFDLKMDTTASDQVLIQKGMPASGGDGKPGWRVMQLASGYIAFDIGTTTGSWGRFRTTSGVGTSAVKHIAVELVAGLPYIFFDGVLQTGTWVVGTTFIGFAASHSTKALDIGSLSTDSGNVSRTLWLNGQLSRIRMTQNGRYGSTNFTPPSGYLTT